MDEKDIVLSELEIGRRIYLFQGHRVMLDSDLAEIYGVETRVLNQAVKRNIERFPGEFMFQLTEDENEVLISQIVISKKETRGGRQKLPFVFTEFGVAMLSGVLNSPRAIQANITIIKAFIKLRQVLETNRDFNHRLDRLEKHFDVHDQQIKAVFDAIRQLMTDSATPRKRIKGLAR